MQSKHLIPLNFVNIVSKPLLIKIKLSLNLTSIQGIHSKHKEIHFYDVNNLDYNQLKTTSK